VITPRHPSGESPEDDPTGVRALLASLPEPEPMPAYLIERISASLAAEQANRSPAPTGATVIPLARRRPLRTMALGLAGVAAAALVVGVVGTSVLHRPDQSSSGAAASMSTATRGTPSAPAPSSAPAQGTGTQGDGTQGLAATPPMHIQMSSTRSTRGSFAAQAGALATSGPAHPVQPLTGESPGIGPIATPTGLASCLRALGVGRVDDVTADLSFYEGTPAVVIVTVSGSARTAYAVKRSCSTGNQALLHPAVPVS
jgi:negative regulator of sigma E activity